MEILVIYKGGYPNGLAMTKRLQLYVKGLKETGNMVNIIIPHATDKFGKKINNEIKGEFDGVQFEYLSDTTERSNSFLKKRLYDFSGFLKLLRYVLLHKRHYKIVLLVDIRNSWRIPIYLICKVRKIKVVYELNEHPFVFSGKLKFWFEKNIFFKMFDGYFVISKNLETLVNSFKKEKCQVLKIPIITDDADMKECDNNSDKINRDYIIHTGGLSDTKEGIINMLKALYFVNNNSSFKIDFFFTGNLNESSDANKIKNVIENLSLQDNVKFLGYISNIEVLNYQKRSLLGIINKPDNLQNNYCFPTKLGEYMVIGKPIIASKVGEYMNYLKNDYNAIILVDNTPECLGESIIKVLRDKEHYEKMGINGKITADSNFNYRVQAFNINAFLNNLIK